MINIERLAKNLEKGLAVLSDSNEAFAIVTGKYQIALGTHQVDGWRCFINLEHADSGNIGVAQDIDSTIRVKRDGGYMIIINYESGCEWHVLM